MTVVLQLESPAWGAWRRVFDHALGLVLTLLTTTAHGRFRREILRSKLEHQFWPTVPEVLWAARLSVLGYSVEVEPLAKGPDLAFREFIGRIK